MNYRIARKTENNKDGVSIVTTEYLSWSDGEIIEFDKRKDCEVYCEGMGIDKGYICEEDDEIS